MFSIPICIAYFDIVPLIVPLEMHSNKWSWFYDIDRCQAVIKHQETIVFFLNFTSVRA